MQRGLKELQAAEESRMNQVKTIITSYSRISDILYQNQMKSIQNLQQALSVCNVPKDIEFFVEMKGTGRKMPGKVHSSSELILEKLLYNTKNETQFSQVAMTSKLTQVQDGIASVNPQEKSTLAAADHMNLLNINITSGEGHNVWNDEK